MSTAAKTQSLIAAVDADARIAWGSWGDASWKDIYTGEIVHLDGVKVDAIRRELVAA